MPVITFEGGKLTKEQKREMIQKFTDVAVEVTGTPKQFFTAIIREQEDQNLGVAGETVEDLKKKMALKK